LGNLPQQFSDRLSGTFATRDDLLSRNEALHERLLVLERRAMKYASLATENSRLRELLNGSSMLDDRVVIADVVGVTPDPFSHEIVLNKGRRDRVSVGQAVLDAHGLMGQVIQVGALTSRIMLISDSSHAVPVEVNRSGLRAVLLGTGKNRSLELVHVPDTADVREGDLLVSSGLGGRFPKGYPVATVTRIERDPGEPFVTIDASPLAQLNQSNLVLIVFPGENPRNAISEDMEPMQSSEETPAPAPERTTQGDAR